MTAPAQLAGPAETVARVAQIQAMISAPKAAASTSSTSFAATLQSAQQTAGSTAASAVSGGDGAQYDALINASAQSNGVDPALLKGLIRQESGFNPQARSGAGAVGLTQLMPSTAASLGVTDPSDPAQAIEGGAKYLRQQLDRFGGDQAKALAAYNAGPGAVARFGGVPPYAETQAYVQRVLGYAQQYGSAPAAATTTSPTLTNPITT